MAVAKTLYGVFPIYKPSGYSTNSIMKILKNNLGVDKISHSGGLNKYAEGIMVMGVGRATKYNHAIQKHSRMYLVRGVLGVATTTYDSDGDYCKVSPYYHITEKLMNEALNELFVGKVYQSPPAVPTLRFLQRERSSIGAIIPRKQLETEITKIDIIDFDPPSFQLHVYTIGRIHPCSLIHDLGETLESAAHLSHLCRVKQGDFGFRQALHFYDWEGQTIQNNLYLPENDPEITDP